jgi:hypothetical protein
MVRGSTAELDQTHAIANCLVGFESDVYILHEIKKVQSFFFD